MEEHEVPASVQLIYAARHGPRRTNLLLQDDHRPMDTLSAVVREDESRAPELLVGASAAIAWEVVRAATRRQRYCRAWADGADQRVASAAICQHRAQTDSTAH